MRNLGKPNLLILSATINGKREETVKFDLDTLKVVQSRGICNSTLEYHYQVLALFQQNIVQITQQRPNHLSLNDGSSVFYDGLINKEINDRFEWKDKNYD